MNAAHPALRVIEVAQYLTGLTVAQDVWGEASRAVISLLDADWCAVGAPDDAGAIRLHAWAFTEPVFAADWSVVPTAVGPDPHPSAQPPPQPPPQPGPALRHCIAETLDSGFLGFYVRTDPDPEPGTVMCLPITQESRVTAVLAVGHRGGEPPSNECLNVYLAVAGMVGTAATRLASECELREHRRHLAALVEERTAALRATNRQLQREVRERKSNQAILAARLRLIALAPSHGLTELLRATLDEVEALTGSTIGFYHFIDADQRTISLQTWSTNTIQNMCEAVGEGQHYPLDQAGVWVDCVRQGRPIIHNDYASLPQRRGLPPGHVTIVRQLTAPVLRDGRIVAILGVGNKPHNYTVRDQGVVAALADLAWDTVERKRLQDLLQHQATTDELTGLPNRRLFMEQAAQELARSLRYGYDCSIAMIDLDHFKQINDVAGHAAGDQALVTMARAYQASLRETDLFARVGGDEFALLLPQTGPVSAREVVERLRAALAAGPGEDPQAAPALTISVGIASFPGVPGELDALLRCADQALYCAKAAGRNCVCIAPPASNSSMRAP